MPAQNSYHQIHLGERRIIERLYAQGYNASRIAREIFRSRSTVLREIKRNGFALPDGSWNYKAEKAQLRYLIRMRIAPKGKQNKHLGKEKLGNPTIYLRLKPILKQKKKSNFIDTLFRRWRWKYRGQEPLFSWNESWEGKRWRSWYNSRRRHRCHRWEEMGRKTKGFKKRPTPTFYQRLPINRLRLMTSFFNHRKRKKEKRIRWRPMFLRLSKRWWESNPIIGSQKYTAPFAKLFQQASVSPPLPKQKPDYHSSELPVSLQPPLTVFSKLNGTTMSNAPLNRPVLKIPSVFRRGSPQFFLNSA